MNTLEQKPRDALALNEVGRCQVSLDARARVRPVPRNRATGAFILIDRLTNNTVGAGMIVRPPVGPERGALVLGERARQRRSCAAQTSLVSRAERARAARPEAGDGAAHGPHGRGKPTIAYALERRLFDAGRR